MKHKIAVMLRQHFCSHEFRLADLEPRDAKGRVTWPCIKCRKVFRATYGLAILSHGKAVQ